MTTAIVVRPAVSWLRRLWWRMRRRSIVGADVRPKPVPMAVAMMIPAPARPPVRMPIYSDSPFLFLRDSKLAIDSARIGSNQDDVKAVGFAIQYYADHLESHEICQHLWTAKEVDLWLVVSYAVAMHIPGLECIVDRWGRVGLRVWQTNHMAFYDVISWRQRGWSVNRNIPLPCPPTGGGMPRSG